MKKRYIAVTGIILGAFGLVAYDNHKTTQKIKPTGHMLGDDESTYNADAGSNTPQLDSNTAATFKIV